MTQVDRAIGRVRRRVMLSAALGAVGWCLLAAAVIAGLTLLADRLLPVVSIPVVIYPALAAAALAAAAAWGWRAKPGDEAAANLIDRQLKLKDQISTGLYLQRQSTPTTPAGAVGSSGFAAQVARDAEAAAARVSAPDTVPIQPGGRAWAWAGSTAGVVALLALLMPADADPFGLTDRPTARDRDADTADTASDETDQQQIEQIRQAREQLDQHDLDDPQDLLAELAALTDRDLSNPELQRQMQEELDALQQRLADEADDHERQVRTLENRLSQLDTPPGPADPLADALRRADFPAAQDEMRNLGRQVAGDELTPRERETLAEQLSAMQDHFEQMADAADQDIAEREQQMRDQLEQAGVDEQQREELAERDWDRDAVRETIEQARREAGADEDEAREDADQLAEQIEQQRRASERDAEAGECATGMCDALEQMNESLADGEADRNGDADGEAASQLAEGETDRNGQAPGEGDTELAEGEPGDGDQGFDRAAWEGERSLEQMQRLQERMRRLTDARDETDRLARGSEPADDPADDATDPGPSPDAPDSPDQTADGAGTAPGGPITGEPREMTDYDAQPQDDARTRTGRVIASWEGEGAEVGGDARAEYDAARDQGRTEAEQALTDDRVPRRYHGPIRDYFERLPDDE